MNNEANLGRQETRKHQDPDNIYYFAGALNTTKDLSFFQVVLQKRYKNSKLSIHGSQLSREWPVKDSDSIATEIKTELESGNRVKLILHSLGAVEASVILDKIDKEILTSFSNNLEIDLVSPAGLFSSRKEMLNFLVRFFKQVQPREKLFPGINRGWESVAVLTDLRDFVLRDLEQLMDRPGTVRNIGTENKNYVRAPRNAWQIVFDNFDKELEAAIADEDRERIKSILRMRGHEMTKRYQQWLRGSQPEAPIGKPNITTIKTAARILEELTNGLTWRVMQQMREVGVNVRVIYPTLDTVVTKENICQFFRVDPDDQQWKKLISENKVIEILGGHATHLLNPLHLVAVLD